MPACGISARRKARGHRQHPDCQHGYGAAAMPAPSARALVGSADSCPWHREQGRWVTTSNDRQRPSHLLSSGTLQAGECFVVCASLVQKPSCPGRAGTALRRGMEWAPGKWDWGPCPVTVGWSRVSSSSHQICPIFQRSAEPPGLRSLVQSWPP